MPKVINSNIATCETSPRSEILCKDNLEIVSIEKKFDPSTVNIFISLILQDVIDENIHKTNQLIKNSFYMKNLPNLNFADFNKRIIKYLKPECSTLIISLIYIDSLANIDREKLFLTENNIFKIYLTSIVLAIKYNEDYYDDNAYFSKVGGVSLTEMNDLEREFLTILDYKLFVNEDLYKIYEDNFNEYEN